MRFSKLFVTVLSVAVYNFKKDFYLNNFDGLLYNERSAEKWLQEYDSLRWTFTMEILSVNIMAIKRCV